MLKFGWRGRVTCAVAAVATAAGVIAFSVWPASGSSVRPAAANNKPSASAAHVLTTPHVATAVPTTLSATDTREIDAAASYFSAGPGSVVNVLRGPGTVIWNAVAPGASTIDNTPELMSHEFLLVMCTTNVTQTQYDQLGVIPGTTPAPAPVIAEADVVIDEVTGRVLTATYIPKGKVNPFASAAAIAKLGTPVTMALP